jgi:triacylglycerol lipase
MPERSTLARLLALLLLADLALIVGWVSWIGQRSPLLALAGALALGLAHAPVLAAEFLLVPLLRRGDPAPPAGARALVRAWWVEIWLDLAVFAWRQPFRWRRHPDRLAGPGVAGRRGMVLVHGIVCNRGFWGPWLARLEQENRAFVAVNLEPVFAPIDDHVQAVERAVAAVSEATGLPPLVVGHSMGGLVVRAWLGATGAARVHHAVTLGTPHAGTWLARFARLDPGRQMHPQGDWLAALAGRWTPGLGARFTCWYSNCDNVVQPPSTATLPGADNRLEAGAAHVELAFRPRVMDQVFGLLSAPQPEAGRR